MVQRQGDALIADLRQEREGIERIVIGKAVGVVSQSHESHFQSWRCLRPEGSDVAFQNTCSKTLHKKQNRRGRSAEANLTRLMLCGNSWGIPGLSLSP